jgi:hypothetical protein
VPERRKARGSGKKQKARCKMQDAIGAIDKKKDEEARSFSSIT